MDVTFRTLLAADLRDDAHKGAPQSALGSVSLEELLATLSFPSLPDRPYVLLNMICTVDGRATIDGRSGAIGNRADHELFHGLRTLPDAVMIGAQTLRIERYNRIVADARGRRSRVARGLREEPLACVVSASLALDPGIPLLADTGARVAILTPSQREIPHVAARVSYVRAEREGRFDLGAALATLHERHAVHTLLCEGGPHLAGELLASDLLDELFLTIAPKLAAGDVESEPSGPAPERAALSIVSGPALDPPVQLELCSLLEFDSYLFARYRVRR